MFFCPTGRSGGEESAGAERGGPRRVLSSFWIRDTAVFACCVSSSGREKSPSVHIGVRRPTRKWGRESTTNPLVNSNPKPRTENKKQTISRGIRGAARILLLVDKVSGVLRVSGFLDCLPVCSDLGLFSHSNSRLLCLSTTVSGVTPDKWRKLHDTDHSML